MHIAYHALELFEAPRDQIRVTILQWLVETGFTVSSSSPSDCDIRAERGSAIAVTDEETGRVMEVIIQGLENVTAVSVYHHTTRIGPIAGVAFGDVLRDEAHALLEFLTDTMVENL